MKEMLQEGVSNIVYHFTRLEALKNIIENNRINFSSAQRNKTDMECQPEGYNYYLSLTRQSSPLVGYSGMINSGNKNVSSELDEDANDKYRKTRTRQLDQFGVETYVRRKNYKKYDKDAPESKLTPKQLLAKRVDRLIKPTAKFDNGKGTNTIVIDKNQSANRDRMSQNSETEERIFSKTSTFENVYDYILRIDIFPFLKELKVRICFDGNKINQNFLGGPVDYIYKKYINGVKYSTLAEARGRKPKGQLMSADEWQILKDCFKEIQISKQTGKDNFENVNLYWGDKIFLHLTSKTMNLGNPMLQKYIDSNIVTDKDLNKMIKQNAPKTKSKKAKEVPELKMAKINTLLKIIFILTPPDSRAEKIKKCKDICQKYFSNIVIVFNNKKYNLSSLLEKQLKTNEDIWDWWNNAIKYQKVFNEVSKRIASVPKDFNGSLRSIYDSLNALFDNFLKLYNINRATNIPYNLWNRYHNNEPSKGGRKPKQAIAITEEDIKEMVTEAIKRII